MSQLAFRNKKTGKTFKVLAFDKTTTPPTVTMQGDNAQFTEPYDKARFEALGYELVKVGADGKVAA